MTLINKHWLVLCGLLIAGSVQAQVEMSAQVISSGGGQTSGGGILITSTFAQPVIGITTSAARLQAAGFWYWVREGGFRPTKLEELIPDDGSLPGSYRLDQNYPNPFNPTTTIGFQLPETSYVRLTILNMLGQEVKMLADHEFGPGAYRVTWDARDVAGRQVSSGLYLYRIETDGFTRTRSLVLLK